LTFHVQFWNLSSCLLKFNFILIYQTFHQLFFLYFLIFFEFLKLLRIFIKICFLLKNRHKILWNLIAIERKRMILNFMKNLFLRESWLLLVLVEKIWIRFLKFKKYSLIISLIGLILNILFLLNQQILIIFGIKLFLEIWRNELKFSAFILGEHN